MLTSTNHRPYRALQRLRAELFSAEMAELLNLGANSVALYMERRSYLRDGRAVEFTRSFYRGDSYDFVTELQLDVKTSRFPPIA